ncbi:MAG: hypothetical protein ISR65_10250 [Bacteriovoracaceae bacterium]|nr:hypothetical protein [Bacteriovoracaceae bacterium]
MTDLLKELKQEYSIDSFKKYAKNNKHTIKLMGKIRIVTERSDCIALIPNLSEKVCFEIDVVDIEGYEKITNTEDPTYIVKLKDNSKILKMEIISFGSENQQYRNNKYDFGRMQFTPFYRFPHSDGAEPICICVDCNET